MVLRLIRIPIWINLHRKKKRNSSRIENLRCEGRCKLFFTDRNYVSIKIYVEHKHTYPISWSQIYLYEERDPFSTLLIAVYKIYTWFRHVRFPIQSRGRTDRRNDDRVLDQYKRQGRGSSEERPEDQRWLQGFFVRDFSSSHNWSVQFRFYFDGGVGRYGRSGCYNYFTIIIIYDWPIW